MLKVKAARKGQSGGYIRRKGEEFTIPDESKFGSWMTPVGWKPELVEKDVAASANVDVEQLKADKETQAQKIAELEAQLEQATKPPEGKPKGK